MMFVNVLWLINSIIKYFIIKVNLIEKLCLLLVKFYFNLKTIIGIDPNEEQDRKRRFSGICTTSPQGSVLSQLTYARKNILTVINNIWQNRLNILESLLKIDDDIGNVGEPLAKNGDYPQSLWCGLR